MTSRARTATLTTDLDRAPSERIRLTEYGDLAPPSWHAPSPVPEPRGSLSEWVLTTLRREPGPCGAPPPADDDPVDGEDSALALYLLYELHYRGLEGIDDRWEWEPGLLAGRHRLERDFAERLRERVPMPPVPRDISAALRDRVANANGPALAAYCEHEATTEQLAEVLVHRTGWQLKEADPHTWALPRLGGRPKASLARIQGEEYGDGVERDVHQNLYALTLSLLGLDGRYGAYLDLLPGVTLATVNLATFFGLHRTWVPAMVGHLAAFEMSSPGPMSAYSAALRRIEAPQDARLFFDVHVVADSDHRNVAADELAPGLVEQNPEAGALILFGVDALMETERAFATHVLESWKSSRTSLRYPLAA